MCLQSSTIGSIRSSQKSPGNRSILYRTFKFSEIRMAQEQGSTKFKHRALRMSNICRCQEPRTNQEGKTTSRIIEEVTYCSLARRPENARTWDKAHRNRKVAEVRDLSFCAGGRLTLARAHKDANSKDCADCADSVCENADSSARHPRWSARRQEASGRQEFGCHQ